MRSASLRNIVIALVMSWLAAETSLANDLSVSTELSLTESASTLGVGIHAGIHGSGLGLATSVGLGSSYTGDAVGSFSGELRYTLDVFTYVPWVSLGFGMRVADQLSLFPQASLGCAMMLGFDDSVGVRLRIPLEFQSFRSKVPFEAGLFWSRNF